MGRGSAVRSSVDVGALSSAVARPGIDPRAWVRLAVITSLGFDADEGPFADVEFQPTGETETCLIGAAYAGDGFGFWAPIEVGDTVLVAIPDGDTGNGPVVICRMWSMADSPSPDFGDGSTPSSDVVLRVKPGKKLRFLTSDSGDGVEITVQGDGNVVIQATGDGKVFLGGTEGTEPIALADTLKSHLDQLKLWGSLLQTHVHTGVTVGAGSTGPSPALTNGPPSVPDIAADEAEVK